LPFNVAVVGLNV